MAGRISMLTYDEADGQDNIWAIAVSAAEQSFVVYATLGAPHENISADHLTLHIWHGCLPQTDGRGLDIDGRGLDIDGRGFTPLILGEPDSIDMDWFLAYNRTVKTYDAASLGGEFTTSQLWAWSYIEGLVEKGILGMDALEACGNEKRDHAVREAVAKARWLARANKTTH